MTRVSFSHCVIQGSVVSCGIGNCCICYVYIYVISFLEGDKILIRHLKRENAKQVFVLC